MSALFEKYKDVDFVKNNFNLQGSIGPFQNLSFFPTFVYYNICSCCGACHITKEGFWGSDGYSDLKVIGLTDAPGIFVSEGLSKEELIEKVFPTTKDEVESIEIVDDDGVRAVFAWRDV